MRNNLIQIINRELADCGYSQPRSIKVRVHEVLITHTLQEPDQHLTQIAQNLAMQYQDVEMRHDDDEVIAMNLLSG